MVADLHPDTANPESAGPAGRPPRLLLIGIALATVYLIWGSTYLGIRVMVEDMPPLVAAGTRFLLAGVLLAGVLSLRGGWRRLRVDRAQLASCALLGMLLPVLGQGMVTVAESGGAPSGLTALLVAGVPLWVLLYRRASGERPARAAVLGAVVGFVGLAGLLIANGGNTGFPFWTVCLVVFATVAWAFGSWYQPRLRLPRDPFVTTVYEMLIGGAVLTAVGLGSGERFEPAMYAAGSWIAWAYLVVFGSVIAFSAYVWLLASAPVSLVATYAYVNPLVALLLGRLILDEAVTAPIVVGGAVVLLAVAIVVKAERPRRPRDAPASEPTVQ
ncbi:EamA family transporter [Glycomyces sp. TRM65418]|uniref:EamA family transporter n=1 Tax=Glycomyces sp. TRM65418 TaxID=2867006 RepID=UPI001CE5B98F|nr:EamA family transporter [Glycomyces sp. TRM65418]MCC3765847.1 EamA family transporter [Glycomyces sp. TRM65418]QZD57971.1 EamA family transporter [Glycomyces sp. TRM65418]